MALGAPACAVDDDNDALDVEAIADDAPTARIANDIDNGLASIDLDAENSPAQVESSDAVTALGTNPVDARTAESATTVIAAVAPKSQGFYSIPYETGTEVRVTGDHLTHANVPNRIDMKGVSGGPYRIVAAASGRVRFVEDSHNVNGGCANNNYVWIEHSNGEWTKYSHIAYHTASVSAGLSAGEWVTAGQFLGIESDIGCASGDHLHFEVGVPTDPSDPINPVGGYIKGTNRVPKVCGIEGQLYVDGQTYVVPEVRPGFAEYARHGLSDSAFQDVFDAASNCGYRLDWNDGFEVSGDPYYNVLFHPNTGPSVSWLSHRRLTEAQLDARIADYVDDQGYSLVHLDVYNVGDAIRYAAIFKKGASIPATTTYYGVSAANHQTLFDALTAGGWRPRVVSATSVDGTRTYGAVYTLGSIGSFVLKSAQTSAEYQANFDANAAAGRRLIYLNSYVHNNAPYYTAIWASSAPSVYARHGMSSATYQSVWQTRVDTGWSTAAVTGSQAGGVTRYAAFWTK
ncbi:MAG: peptidoglycan DD-metalloendopeptidase family protein [Kofleriaceae bacterium]